MLPRCLPKISWAPRSRSKKVGTQGGASFRFAVDGSPPSAKLTIDVAYRSFPRIGASSVADTPGHEQYTRNMVTGA